MKTLNKILEQIYGDRPIEGPEKAFVDKHVIRQFGVIDGKDYAGNKIDGPPYKATNTQYARFPRHGYDEKMDKKVYEETELKAKFHNTMHKKTEGNAHFAKKEKEYSDQADKEADDLYAKYVYHNNERIKHRNKDTNKALDHSHKASQAASELLRNYRNSDRYKSLVDQSKQRRLKKPTNEELVTEKISPKALAKGLRARATSHRDMGYAKVDAAERHGQKANEAPTEGERKFYKKTESGVLKTSRKYFNKAEKYDDAARRTNKRVAGVVSKLAGK